MKIGYARTSTSEQIAGFEAQTAALKAAGCEEIFREQVSALGQRAQVEAAFRFLRQGEPGRCADCLVITKLDRLARSVSDLWQLIERLEAKGAGLVILDFGGGEIDTRTPAGRVMLTMFGAMAQFEREIMLDRQRAGIARAQAEGKYRGRSPSVRRQLGEIRRLQAEGVSLSEIARRLGVGRSSLYRVLEEDHGAA